MTTREEVIAAAKEVDPSIDETTVDFDDEVGMKKLERFYAIAYESGRQAEREECAKVCEIHADGWNKNPGNNPMAGYIATSNCADAIRKRNTK